jgi:hypothetical protein
MQRLSKTEGTGFDGLGVEAFLGLDVKDFVGLDVEDFFEVTVVLLFDFGVAGGEGFGVAGGVHSSMLGVVICPAWLRLCSGCCASESVVWRTRCCENGGC